MRKTAVLLSGLTKQDYITHCLLNHPVVVQGNLRGCKALKDQLAALLPNGMGRPDKQHPQPYRKASAIHCC